MKMYPVSEDQLDYLAHIDWAGALCLSIGTGLLSFCIDLSAAIGLSSGVAKETVSWWSGINYGVAIGSGVFLVAGVFLLFWNWTKRNRIKGRTKFPDEDAYKSV